jgi:hypothetical protein
VVLSEQLNEKMSLILANTNIVSSGKNNSKTNNRKNNSFFLKFLANQE